MKAPRRKDLNIMRHKNDIALAATRFLSSVQMLCTAVLSVSHNSVPVNKPECAR